MLNNIFEDIKLHSSDPAFDDVFYNVPAGIELIKYRQDVFNDLNNNKIYNSILAFQENSKQILYNISMLPELYNLQKKRWLLDSANIYCNSIISMYQNLKDNEIKSNGFRAFRSYLENYISSGNFQNLAKSSKELENLMGKIKYSMTFKGSKIIVRKYQNEEDYVKKILSNFSRFFNNNDFPKHDNYNTLGHVEAAIVDIVSKFYPEEFNKLDDFNKKFEHFIDPVIEKFMHEIEFYLKYISYMNYLKKTGIEFCIPKITKNNGNVELNNFFDLALAENLLKKGMPIISNNYYPGKNYINIVTGPNRGGKSTFLKSIGQSQLMMQAGMFIPEEFYKAPVVYGTYTHFNHEEDLTMKRGKFDDELHSMKDITDHMRKNRLILFNESFSSTDAREGSEIAVDIARALVENNIKVFFVSHLYEFASSIKENSNYSSVFLVTERSLNGDRTYKIVAGEPSKTGFGMDVYKKIFCAGKQNTLE